MRKAVINIHAQVFVLARLFKCVMALGSVTSIGLQNY